MKKIWIKILLTIALIVIAFACFYFPKAIETTRTISVDPIVAMKTDNSGFIKFIQYIGLFCMVFSVWIWRNLLKISSVGFIGGPDIKSGDPETIDSNFKKESISEPEVPPTNTEYEKHKLDEKKRAIINLMEESYTSITRISSLAHKLKLSKGIIEMCLFELQRDGIVRKDVVPGSLVGNYSMTDSWINRGIDNFRNTLNGRNEAIISDLRYLQIRNLDIDALIETDNHNYVVEVKSLSKHLDSKVIERGIKQLLNIEEELKSKKAVKLVLLFVLHKDFDLNIDHLEDEFSDVKDNLEITYFRLT
ncbi:MAG: hypothetical protein ABFS38_14225 [Bacteroidota bacterium]